MFILSDIFCTNRSFLRHHKTTTALVTTYTANGHDLSQTSSVLRTRGTSGSTTMAPVYGHMITFNAVAHVQLKCHDFTQTNYILRQLDKHVYT